MHTEQFKAFIEKLTHDTNIDLISWKSKEDRWNGNLREICYTAHYKLIDKEIKIIKYTDIFKICPIYIGENAGIPLQGKYLQYKLIKAIKKNIANNIKRTYRNNELEAINSFTYDSKLEQYEYSVKHNDRNKKLLTYVLTALSILWLPILIFKFPMTFALLTTIAIISIYLYYRLDI